MPSAADRWYARFFPAKAPMAGPALSPIAAAGRQAPATSLRGIALALLAWLLFAAMDAGSKLLAAEYSVIQILWVRYLALLAVAWGFARRDPGGPGLRTRHIWLQSLRSLLLVVEIGLFIAAIAVLPLADAHAIIALTPLLVTALSVPLLGERVGIRRWSAIGIAFLGMLVILRPGWSAIHPMSLVVLLCALMFALYQVLTRMVGRDDGPAVTLFYTALLGAVGLTVIGPFFWAWPDARGWALFAMVAVLGASGHFLLIYALKLAEASALQPFSYSVLIWATIVGFTVFGDLPDLFTVVGALIIVASGLYAFYRERVRAQPLPERP
jgi:drug/metabolite transporter (DMT)-like permease